MIPLTSDPWASKVLDPAVHTRLVARKDEFAQDAGIPEGFIWSPLEASLPSEEERLWVRRLRHHRNQGYSGLIYIGSVFDPTIEVRMCGMAGAFLRNFVRARVMSMETVYQHMRVGQTPEATVLLMPTFGEARADERRVSMMADLLVERWNSTGSQTVVAAPSYDAVAKVYGGFVRDHIRSHYVEVRGQK